MVSQKDRMVLCLKALSDSTRCSILELLKRNELSVLEIAERFPMSRPAISKHLRILKEAGLVVERASGRQRIYAVDPIPLGTLQGWLGKLLEGGPGKIRLEVQGKVPGAGSIRAGTGTPDWRVW